MTKPRRRLRNRSGPPPAEPAEAQQLSALRAAALGLLLAGLTGDGARVGVETGRIIAAGEKVTAAVIGFLTAHAAEAYTNKYGSQEAAIDAVSTELDAAVLAASERQL